MFPPTQSLQLDIDAISQICGSVSIACWIGMYLLYITYGLLPTDNIPLRLFVEDEY